MSDDNDTRHRLAKKIAGVPATPTFNRLTASTPNLSRLAEQIAASEKRRDDVIAQANETLWKAQGPARELAEAQGRALQERVAREEATLETLRAVHDALVDEHQAAAERETASAEREKRMLTLTIAIVVLTVVVILIAAATLIVAL